MKITGHLVIRNGAEVRWVKNRPALAPNEVAVTVTITAPGPPRIIGTITIDLPEPPPAIVEATVQPYPGSPYPTEPKP